MRMWIKEAQILNGDKTFLNLQLYGYKKYILFKKCDNEVLKKYEIRYYKIYQGSNYLIAISRKFLLILKNL